MAVDRALLRSCESGRSSPVVRLYGWREPTLTVGYSQSLERDLDLARCRELGIPVVRRPTGGRALLHDREVTYAVAAPVNHPDFHPGLREAFAGVAKLLGFGLEELGVCPDPLSLHRPPRRLDRGQRSPACFASLHHYEITVGGKKLIGSAQKRTHRAFLQHGSLLLENDPALLTGLCRYPDAAARRRDLEELKRRTLTVFSARGRPAGFQEAADALARGFRRGLGDECTVTGLTAEEQALRDAFLRGS